MKPAGRFYSETRGARRVLVIDPGMLGDAVHLVPALHELRQNYPAAELHVVSSPVGAEVVALAQCVDRQWVLEQAKERRSLRDQVRLLWTLRRLHFDASLNFGDHDRNVVYAGLIGARHRLGRRGGRWHFWSPWCLGWSVPIEDRSCPVFEQRRRVLAAAGLTLGPARFGLQPTVEAVREAAELVPEGAVHFSINASHPLKEWPLGHWAALGQRLLAGRPDLHIVVSGTAAVREQERLRQLAAAVGGPRLGVLPPGMNIALLAAVLQRSRLHVGGDSGALHLAAAVGTPTLSFFRDHAGLAEWAPQGAGHRLLRRPCPCDTRQGAVPDPPCAVVGTPRCLADIPVDEALAAAVALLEGGAGDAAARRSVP